MDDNEIDFSNVPHKSITATLRLSINYGANDKMSPKKFTSNMNVITQMIKPSVDPKK